MGKGRTSSKTKKGKISSKKAEKAHKSRTKEKGHKSRSKSNQQEDTGVQAKRNRLEPSTSKESRPGKKRALDHIANRSSERIVYFNE